MKIGKSKIKLIVKNKKLKNKLQKNNVGDKNEL